MLTMANSGGDIFAFSSDIPLHCAFGTKNAFLSPSLLIFWVQDLNPQRVQDPFPEKGIPEQDRVAEAKAKQPPSDDSRQLREMGV